MKKCAAVHLSLSLLTGGSADSNKQTYSGAPKTELDGNTCSDFEYAIYTVLPEGYVYAGKLSETQKQ
jgi:hypothetical protein